VADTSSAPRASTLRFQGLANRIVRTLLATPLIARGVGKRLVTVHVVGRKSGKRYDVPVAYTREGDALLIGTPFAWAKNLRSGEAVEVTHLGRRRRADVQVFTDEADVVRYYEVIARDNKQFAGFNKIGFDAAGNPDPQDLHLAWKGGARVLRLSVT
jgi:deazaflavin-dependent oxidoreductase (nitroreductase family)